MEEERGRGMGKGSDERWNSPSVRSKPWESNMSTNAEKRDYVLEE